LPDKFTTRLWALGASRFLRYEPTAKQNSVCITGSFSIMQLMALRQASRVPRVLGEFVLN